MNDAITEAEEQLVNAMKNGDCRRLDRMLHDKLLFTDHNGQVVDKATDMQMHRSGKLAIDRMDTGERLVVSLGSVSIVSVRAQVGGRYDGIPFGGDFRYTRVWKMMDGRLQVIAGSCVAMAQ
ncbi:nuclear transport factor 2 family protein [Salmonirosea aquatica]|uniref:DUF4440 domain-containing protein n=1 Tax=Salmonirosea aquatica TaxID=2654236 RepID=A0A7C9FC08_9BACT|nr:DUF4440 domain-containing protein [Cytophagaceae bacterium SJW1-29]